MAWVPGPITLDNLNPTSGVRGTGALTISANGVGFRPTTSIALTHTQDGQALAVSDIDVTSPNELSFQVLLDDASAALGTYDATVTNPPADGTTPADNTMTLPAAFALV